MKKSLIFVLILSFIPVAIYAADLKDTRVDGILYVGNTTASAGLQDNALIVDGNVGIGTVNPSDRLVVGGTDERITGASFGEFIDFNDDGDDNIVFGGASGADNTDIAFDLDGTEPAIYSPTDSKVKISDSFLIQPPTDSTTGVQVLDSDGGVPILNIDTDNERVGIGTAEPTSLLDINGTAKVGGGVITLASSSDTFFFGTQTAKLTIGGAKIADNTFGIDIFPFSGDDGALRVTRESLYGGSGKGITFQAKGADATGNVTLEANNTNLALGSGGSKDIIFGSGRAEKMRMLANGNVGIGTTGPGYTLDVHGDIGFETTGAGAFVEFRRSGTTGGTIDLSSGDFRLTASTNNLILKTDADEDVILDTRNVGIGTTNPNEALTIEAGVISIKETTAPSATATYAKIWTEDNNEIFVQTGDGNTHLLHGDAFSVIWAHFPTSEPVEISTQDRFTKIDSFTAVGKQDDLGNVTGNVSTNTLTLSSIAAGEYQVSYHGSITATGGADKEMKFAFGIVLATPKDITNVTDDTVTPIVITSAGHGLENGDMVEIVGVIGNDAANGSFVVDNKAPDTFEIVALDGNATTGDGDYNEGSPTGDVTIEYSGQMSIHRMVRGADFGAISATGIHDLANSDAVSVYVANLSGITNLTVSSISLGIFRIGD